MHEILLKPAGMDCKYHYPFGSQDFMSQREFREFDHRRDHHAFFYYDQEPIWTTETSRGYDTDAGHWAWSSRTCRLLANSERSDIKKTLCRERNMLDWYFFYHGFAALDWFRDAQHIPDHHVEPRSVYLNLNHQTRHYRSYRISLMARLVEMGILGHGINSFHSDRSAIEDELSDPDTLLPCRERDRIMQLMGSTCGLPMIADTDSITATASAHFGHREHRFWQSAAWHLVNETVFYQPKLHLTEKVFKPIVALRPFVLVAAPGNLEYLRSYGFQTFGHWIDESYDQESDPVRRLDLITAEVQKLCQLGPKAIQRMLADMAPVLRYNKQHFFGRFREIIVNELVDNFETCLRIWNNGRLDARIDHDWDPAQAKSLLLRG